ncbi:MAG: hypothetical protein ACXVA9_01110 [Bdellovibrionales bacterium]
MKLIILAASLVLSMSTNASVNGTSPGTTSPGTIVVKCTGNLGAAQVDKTLQFGGSNLSKQDFAIHDGVIFAIQLASYKGFIDIILLQEVRDLHGNVLSSGYIRSHGGTELDLVDNAKGITLICDMEGQP